MTARTQLVVVLRDFRGEHAEERRVVLPPDRIRSRGVYLSDLYRAFTSLVDLALDWRVEELQSENYNGAPIDFVKDALSILTEDTGRRSQAYGADLLLVMTHEPVGGWS